MASVFRNRITLTFLLLVAATALSWALGHGFGFSDIRYANAFIIVIAFVKIRYVFMDFMEVRHSPAWLRVVSDTWVLLVCVTVVGLYWLGSDHAATNHWPRIQGL